MNLKDTYNKIADNWSKDHKNDTWWIEGTDKFIAFLKRGDRVLDVGCGAGTKSKYLIAKGLDVTGIDFSEKMVEIASREVPRGKFLVLDMKDICALAEEYDGIFIQAVLLHIPKADVPGVLDCVNKKLKNGGYVYVAVKEKKAGGPEEEVLSEDDYGYKYEIFFSYFTAEELKTYLLGAGMEVVWENAARSGKTNWIQFIAAKLN